MCGIAGFFACGTDPAMHERIIGEMLSTIVHRGPDEIGYYLDDHAALGCVRLGIIDLANGSQPMGDASQRYWIAYNGEVYNYLELRRELADLGCRFRTGSDTEVVQQAWIEWGFAALARLNGGYAFCIYDALERSITLVRDRFGKRPLFYAQHHAGWLFASEMKAFSVFPGWRFAWDADALRSVFACWTPLPDDGCYQGVRQVLPGCCVRFCDGQVTQQRYWRPDPAAAPFPGSRQEAEETIRSLLADSVRLRLRSDVEVATYLSGGIDSAAVTCLAQEQAGQRIHSFSVSFADPDFDESAYQRRLSEALGTSHHVLTIEPGDIARSFPAALLQAEIPVFRTAFVPLHLLSAKVREHGIKVVLTGEGADEAFLGYDIFKEAWLLQHWATMSAEQRSDFVAAMYPYLKHFSKANARLLVPLYERQAQLAEHWSLSHATRFANSALAGRLLQAGSGGEARLQRHLAVQHPAFLDWSSVQRGQLIELATLLPGYLLSTQGDRATLAHGVENRCPFLDYRLFEFAASLPVELRLEHGLREKQILKSAFAEHLPPEIAARPKQPYRAPDAPAFLGQAGQVDEVDAALHPAELATIEVLDLGTSLRFLDMIRRKPPDRLSQAENQAFVLLLSLSLLNRSFVCQGHDFRQPRWHLLPRTIHDRRSLKPWPGC